jgi:hypothetical protein
VDGATHLGKEVSRHSPRPAYRRCFNLRKPAGIDESDDFHCQADFDIEFRGIWKPKIREHVPRADLYFHLLTPLLCHIAAYDPRVPPSVDFG